MSSLWLPGHGTTTLEGTSVDRAVREYDERLLFGKNEATGDFCIFIRMPPEYDGPTLDGSKVLPILGFGQELPSSDYALRRLYQSDSLRHGQAILDGIHRNNEAQRKVFRDAADEGQGQLVEAMESYHRNQGNLGYSRSVRADSKRTAVKSG